MPVLSRRCSTVDREECWHAFYGDVQVGRIAIRTGNPSETDSWQWRCGFYPGSRPGECTTGTAATFDQAHRIRGCLARLFSSIGPKPISKSGGISRRGPPKNIGASIEASACPTIGAPVADCAAGCHSRRAN
jgi:hypothetical protein